MRDCKEQERILEDYVWGLAQRSELDTPHLANCAACRESLQRADLMRSQLKLYRRDLDRKAGEFLESRRPSRPKRRMISLRWLGVAAAFLVAFLLGYLARDSADAPSTQIYVDALQDQSAREELRAYLQSAQLFLLSQLDERSDCEESRKQDRQLLTRLLYRKSLLDPKLQEPPFADLRPLLDEIEFLLLGLAEGLNCEDPDQWKARIESRSTLIKINLLQVEDRI